MKFSNFFKRHRSPKRQSLAPSLPGTGLYHLNTDELTNQYTDPINVQELYAWNELQKYNPRDRHELFDANNTVDCRSYGQHWKYLIHMIRNPDTMNPIFFKNRFSDMIKNWDAMSTSLISNEKSNAVVGYFGFILDVPSQNILSTNYKDIGFYNHAGVDFVNGVQVVTDRSALVHHINLYTNRLIQSPNYILSRTGDMGSHADDVARLYKDFPRKEFPAHFRVASSYNEIVIVTKPHLRIYPQKNASIGATSPVGVKGIYVLNNTDYLSTRHYGIIRQLAMLNKVPALYIRHNGVIMVGPGQEAKKISRG